MRALWVGLALVITGCEASVNINSNSSSSPAASASTATTRLPDISAFFTRGGKSGTLLGGASLGTGCSGQGLVVPRGGYAKIDRFSEISATNRLTISLWVKPEASELSVILGMYDGGAGGYGLYRKASGTLHFVIGGGSSDSVTVAPISTWTHVAGTFDGSTRKVYVNGVLAKSDLLTHTIVTPPGDMILGDSYDRDRYPYPFTGRIDDVRIYLEVLDASAISNLAAACL